MKHIISLFLWLVLIATSIEGDNPKGWFSLGFPADGHIIEDLCFVDSLRGWAITNIVNDTSLVLYTEDGGEDWQVQWTDAYLYSIDFVNETTGYIAASSPPGKILKTTNQGVNWFTIAHLEASPLWDIDFVNSDTGWVCSDDLFDGGIFRTTNGGASWQRQVQPLLGYQHLDFLNKDTGWCLLNDGKVFKTTNSGMNWNQISTVVPPGIETGIQFANANKGWILTGQSNLQGIYRTTNGGISWDLVHDPAPIAWTPSDLKLFSNDNGWISKEFGMLTLVNDSNLGIQIVPQSPLPRLRAIEMVDTLTGYAAGGVILKTTDGGGPITGINNNGSAEIGTYSLIGNYPNPFNSQTVIRYKLKEPGYVTMEIFDIAGRLVSQPVSSFMPSGNHEVVFDASALSSGVYACLLKVSDKAGIQAFAGSIKMILSK